MIRPCVESDFSSILEIINDGAQAYRGVIPADRLKEPYVSEGALRHELESGGMFWGTENGSQLAGVMGVQDVLDVTLIRPAYVRPRNRRQGLGGELLERLRDTSQRPYLVGTWAAATWAIEFYRRHGFRLLSPEATRRVLKKYWTIPERQIATSVVLADENWQSR